MNVTDAILIPLAAGDPGRFGTVVDGHIAWQTRTYSDWAKVEPFNEKMRVRAFQRGARSLADMDRGCG